MKLAPLLARHAGFMKPDEIGRLLKQTAGGHGEHRLEERTP